MTIDTQIHDDKFTKLAHMAGQIADFFKSYPEQESPAAIADHINHFWSRTMRADFLSAYKTQPDSLPPLLQKALPLIKPASR